MRVVYTLRARNDLDAIYLYLKERSPRAASAVLKAIRIRIAKLSHSPMIGPPTTMSGVRGLIILRYPYKAYYRITDNEVSILHVRDSRRAPWTGEN
jgi:plasmid stabilization system protein ParE